jgi:hypothetical protein
MTDDDGLQMWLAHTMLLHPVQPHCFDPCRSTNAVYRHGELLWIHSIGCSALKDLRYSPPPGSAVSAQPVATAHQWHAPPRLGG